MPRSSRLTLVGLALASAGAACGKSSGPLPGGAGSAGGSASSAAQSRAALLAAWRKAGLAPSDLVAATLPIGDDCTTGKVSGVDVAVCAFATAALAEQAEERGLAWVGATTGIARGRGTLLIAAADRAHADPHGKTINELMKQAPATP